MGKEDKQEVIIEDEAQETETPEVDTSDFSLEELESAQKLGILPKDEKKEKQTDDSKDNSDDKKQEDTDEHKEQSEDEAEEDKDKEEKEEAVEKAAKKEDESKAKEPTHQSFEDTEKDEGNLVNNYNPNEKALYFKWKHDKQQRQQAQKDAEEYKNQYEHITVKTKAQETQLQSINELLSGDPNNITVEAIQEILQGKQQDDPNKPLTKQDLEAIEREKAEKAQEQQKQQEFIQNRISAADKIGKSQYDNFDHLVDLAREVMESDKSNTYKDLIVREVQNPEIDEFSLVERTVAIAKLHPDFGKQSKKETKKDKDSSIDRIVENSKKKPSSASVSGGHGRRVVSYDDLTIADAAKLSPDQWAKLPKETRERLLKESA